MTSPRMHADRMALRQRLLDHIATRCVYRLSEVPR